jgi:hypothetical protein
VGRVGGDGARFNLALHPAAAPQEGALRALLRWPFYLRRYAPW